MSIPTTEKPQCTTHLLSGTLQTTTVTLTTYPALPIATSGKSTGNYGKDNGGDCANFVSQCLLAGGHPPLKKGSVEVTPVEWKSLVH